MRDLQTLIVFILGIWEATIGFDQFFGSRNREKEKGACGMDVWVNERITSRDGMIPMTTIG